MPTSFDFRAAVAQVLDLDPEDHASAVLARLQEPDVLAALAEVVHDMLVGPIEANRMSGLEDLEPLMDSRQQAEVIAAAVAAALGRRRLELPSPQVLAAAVDALAYKDWSFSLVQSWGRPAVRVVATVENAYRSEVSFTTSRTVTIERGVAEAALQAVLWIEEHEARERLTLGGHRVLNPHEPPRFPVTPAQ